MLKQARPRFETGNPSSQVLFVFDNTTSHSAYTLDALRATSINLHPEGAQLPLRSGITSLNGEIQAMV